jgi:RNA polymerase sigma-70 factor (ECF subfamily)
MDRVAALYRDHFKFVWHVLWRAHVPAADIPDLAHDVFLVVLRKPPLVDPSNPGPSTRDQERAWLYKIAFYEVKNYRSRGRYRQTKPMDDRTDEIPDAHNEADHLEAQEELLLLLDSTTSDRREVFALVDLEGHSVVAAAHILGITESNAHKRLGLARQDIAAAAAKLAQRNKEAGKKTMSAFLAPFGVGAWLQVGKLQDPPAGTADRVWERLLKSAEEIERENDRPASPPPQKPPLKPRIGRALKGIAGHLKGPIGYVVAACLGGALVALLFLQRPNARIVILQIPGPVFAMTSATATPAPLAAPSSPPALPTPDATSAPDATIDEEAVLLRQARAAYAAGDRAGTIEALNAYERRFPAGRFRNAAHTLRATLPAADGR